ncbi:Uma2 family endonuclease [Nocardia sp. NPDC024068]|uniref:Uma2 family endonuclease n=1 Tax=Nocardia sp. NPDC024068 TaxID=3157197 RepID=UPI0033E84220
MTADPIPTDSRPSLGWPVPPPEGYFAEDLDRLPDLPSHTELIDGSLVFVSPQKMFHMMVINFLWMELKRQTPGQLIALREMTVTLSERQRPEPDVMIVAAAAYAGIEQTTYHPADTVLVIEVVSPDSVERDRKRKPQLYAEAGIQHFWRVENVDGRAVVYTYELDPATGKYTPTGIHHDKLTITVPFDIALDLTRATEP